MTTSAPAEARQADTASAARDATDLRAQLTAAVEHASSLADLTPERVLGISTDEVERLRAGSHVISRQADPLRLKIAETAAALSDRGLSALTGARAVVARSTPGGNAPLRRRIVEQLSSAAAGSGMIVALEELRVGETATTVALGEHVLHLTSAAVGALTESCALRPRCARAAGQPTDPAGDRRDVTLRGERIARLTDEPGRVSLLVNPFVFEGAYTGAGADRRVSLVGEFLAAIDERHRDVFDRPACLPLPSAQDATQERTRREAVAILDMVPAFMAATSHGQTDRIPQLRSQVQTLHRALSDDERNLVTAVASATDLQEQIAALRECGRDDDCPVLGERSAELEAARQTAASRRQVMMDRLREITETQRALDAEINQNGTLSVQRVVHALTEVWYIRQLEPVRSVRAVQNGSDVTLKIALHPVVIGFQGRRYLFDKLVFDLALDRHPRVSWEYYTSHRSSPHPHVSTSGTTCWGHAEQPLSAAAGRLEFSTVVMLICGWAQLYNDSSPYVRIANFPTTTLPEGWHPELDLGI